MTSTTTAPERVEVEAPEQAWAGQSVPRKEDKRLVQGEGVFVDDVKRHGMGYLHFVRSPYAHAHITSIDVSQAEQAPGVYGTLTGEEVAALTDPFFQISSRARRATSRTSRSPSARCGTSARRSSRSSPRRASSRATPPSSSRWSTSRSTPLIDARRARDDDAPVLHDDAGGNLMWEGVY